jgi:hypothetical protein
MEILESTFGEKAVFDPLRAGDEECSRALLLLFSPTSSSLIRLVHQRVFSNPFRRLLLHSKFWREEYTWF